MNILEFLLSKKILVVLSGLIFTSVAVASSGAESLFQENGLIVNETKIPEVQNIIDDQQTSQKNSSAVPPAPTTKPIPSSTPLVSSTPKPQTNSVQPPASKNLSSPTPKPTSTTRDQATITGLRQTGSDDIEDEEDESDKSEINKAFQKANEESNEED